MWKQHIFSRTVLLLQCWAVVASHNSQATMHFLLIICIKQWGYWDITPFPRWQGEYVLCILFLSHRSPKSCLFFSFSSLFRLSELCLSVLKFSNSIFYHLYYWAHLFSLFLFCVCVFFISLICCFFFSIY